jgi:hypothetical protein
MPDGSELSLQCLTLSFVKTAKRGPNIACDDVPTLERTRDVMEIIQERPETCLGVHSLPLWTEEKEDFPVVPK